MAREGHCTVLSSIEVSGGALKIDGVVHYCCCNNTIVLGSREQYMARRSSCNYFSQGHSLVFFFADGLNLLSDDNLDPSCRF
jgi:hypothetical protein